MNAENEKESVFDLREAITGYANSLPPPGKERVASLSCGSANYALFANDLSYSLSLPYWSVQAVGYLESGLNLLQQQDITTSLYSGLSGYGYALSLIATSYEIPWAEDALEDIDRALLESITSTDLRLEWDLINGIIGILIYGFHRKLSNVVTEILNILLLKLCAEFAFLSEQLYEEASPWKSGNLGLAHGIPGVLSILSVAFSRGMLSENDSALATAGFDNLWSLRLADGFEDGIFPYQQGGSVGARLAWCYGGLGLATTFLKGASFSESNAHRAELLTRSCIAQFHRASAGLNDASVCHGYAGVALILMSLSRSPELSAQVRVACADTADIAIKRTISCRVENVGVTIFPHSFGGRMVESDSFLEGSTGVYMTLLANARNGKPRWSDLLLV